MAIVNGIEVGNCGSCPEVMHCFDSLKDMDRLSGLVTKAAFDPVIEEHVDDMFEFVRDTGLIEILEDSTGKTPDNPTDLLVATRQQLARQLDHIDEHKTDVHDTIVKITTDCEGPLKMRATKTGRVLTATICASPTKGDGFSCEDVHVQRDNIPATQNSDVDGQA